MSSPFTSANLCSIVVCGSNGLLPNFPCFFSCCSRWPEVNRWMSFWMFLLKLEVSDTHGWGSSFYGSKNPWAKLLTARGATCCRPYCQLIAEETNILGHSSCLLQKSAACGHAHRLLFCAHQPCRVLDNSDILLLSSHSQQLNSVCGTAMFLEQPVFKIKLPYNLNYLSKNSPRRNCYWLCTIHMFPAALWCVAESSEASASSQMTQLSWQWWHQPT